MAGVGSCSAAVQAATAAVRTVATQALAFIVTRSSCSTGAKTPLCSSVGGPEALTFCVTLGRTSRLRDHHCQTYPPGQGQLQSSRQKRQLRSLSACARYGAGARQERGVSADAEHAGRSRLSVNFRKEAVNVRRPRKNSAKRFDEGSQLGGFTTPTLSRRLSPEKFFARLDWPGRSSGVAHNERGGRADQHCGLLDGDISPIDKPADKFRGRDGGNFMVDWRTTSGEEVFQHAELSR